MWGEVLIKYRGRHPLVFVFTAIGAGVGAVIGLSRAGPLGMLLGAAFGGTAGSAIGYFIETFIEEISRASSNTQVKTASEIPA